MKFAILATLALILMAGCVFAAEPTNNVTAVLDNLATRIYVGNTSQDYTLSFNITLAAAGGGIGDSPNVTISMPYGLVNGSTCAMGFTTPNNTLAVCRHNTTQPIVGPDGKVVFNVTIRANISAFTQYGTYIINVTTTCPNCTGNSSILKTITTVNFWKNPRPEAIRTGMPFMDSQLIINKWQQTESRYDISVPIYAYNQTLGYQTLADDRFADVMFLGGKSLLERPAYARMWSYNLTFRIVMNYTGNASSLSYVIRSPINNTMYPHQTLSPLWCRNQETPDPMLNQSFNMSVCVPHQTNYDIFMYGSVGANYTAESLLADRNITISFSMNKQDETLLFINVSRVNESVNLNNTPISILFTLLNYTEGVGTPSAVSPVYVNLQRINGFDMRSRAPSIGEATNVTYRINLTNRLDNYTLSGLTLSFALPVNITVINNTLIYNVTYNVTRNINITFLNSTSSSNYKYVNGSSGNGVISSLSTLYTYDNLPGSPMLGSNMSITFGVFDLDISNTSSPMAATFNNWDPSPRTNASISLEAEMQFPVFSEVNRVEGTPSSYNQYNATISLSMSGPLNLTNKLAGIDTSSTGIIVLVDGQPISSNNYTLGSLVVDSVTAGMHDVSVEYIVSASAGTTTTVGGGGGGGSAVHTTTTTIPTTTTVAVTTTILEQPVTTTTTTNIFSDILPSADNTVMYVLTVVIILVLVAIGGFFYYEHEHKPKWAKLSKSKAQNE